MNDARYYESRCYEGAPAFERYDPAQCPQRPYGWEDERYHDPHLPTPMKTDQSEQDSNTGPIYPRYVSSTVLGVFVFVDTLKQWTNWSRKLSGLCLLMCLSHFL